MIRRAALNYLARREHTSLELFRKLQHKKKFNDQDIEQALNALKEEGLLSDQRFLDHFIHCRRNKGYGPLRIRAELKSRGIPEDLIEDHLEITDNAWLTDIREVWRKRFKNQLPITLKMRADQARFLQYRGFTHEQINSILKNANDDEGEK